MREFIIYPYNQELTPDPDFKTDGDVPTASTSTTEEVMEPPAHVTSFTANALSGSSIMVSWEDAPGGSLNLFLKFASTSIPLIVVLGAPALVGSVWYCLSDSALQTVGPFWAAGGLVILLVGGIFAGYVSWSHEFRR